MRTKSHRRGRDEKCRDNWRFVAVKRQRFWLEVHHDTTTCGGVVSTTRVPADISVGWLRSSTLACTLAAKLRKTNEKSLVLVKGEIGCCHLRKRPEITNFCSRSGGPGCNTVRITGTCLENVRRKDSTKKQGKNMTNEASWKTWRFVMALMIVVRKANTILNTNICGKVVWKVSTEWQV